jgi:phosphate transport system substrate-binding protein
VKRRSTLVGLVAAGTLALSACGTDDNTTPTPASASKDCASGDIKGAGSTFQKNIVSAWIKAYTADCEDATVDYQAIGSGAGIKQFGAGTVDFAGSDSTMKDDEQAEADKRCGSPALHLPVSAGGIAIAYQLDGVEELQLSPSTLAGIFQGTVRTWDDAAVKADNPGVQLPSTPVTAVHREDSSGTTNVFSKYLAKAAAGTWKLGEGKELSWPAAVQGAKGSDGVTQAVRSADGAITYTEVSYVDSAGLGAVKVKNGAGEYVGPTAEAVSTALGGAALPAAGNDLKVTYDYASTTRGAYPITAVTYDIVCTRGEAATQALLVSFLRYAVTDGQDEAEDNGYAPLPGAVVDRVKAALRTLAAA